MPFLRFKQVGLAIGTGFASAGAWAQQDPQLCQATIAYELMASAPVSQVAAVPTMGAIGLGLVALGMVAMPRLRRGYAKWLPVVALTASAAMLATGPQSLVSQAWAQVQTLYLLQGTGPLTVDRTTVNSGIELTVQNDVGQRVRLTSVNGVEVGNDLTTCEAGTELNQGESCSVLVRTCTSGGTIGGGGDIGGGTGTGTGGTGTGGSSGSTGS